MAVVGLTTTLAAEGGLRGVTVNCLSPGCVEGSRMEGTFRLESDALSISDEEVERRILTRAAPGRTTDETAIGAAVAAMLLRPGLCAADIDLSAGMVG